MPDTTTVHITNPHGRLVAVTAKAAIKHIGTGMFMRPRFDDLNKAGLEGVHKALGLGTTKLTKEELVEFLNKRAADLMSAALPSKSLHGSSLYRTSTPHWKREGILK